MDIVYESLMRHGVVRDAAGMNDRVSSSTRALFDKEHGLLVLEHQTHTDSDVTYAWEPPSHDTLVRTGDRNDATRRAVLAAIVWEKCVEDAVAEGRSLAPQLVEEQPS